MPTPEPCTPEDLQRIASLAADDAYGKMNMRHVIIRHAFDPVESGAEAARRSRFGLFLPTTMRGMFGPEFAARAHNDLIIAVTKSQNALSELAVKQKETLAPAFSSDTFFGKWKAHFGGIPKQLDVELQDAFQNPVQLLSENAKAVAPKLQQFMDHVYDTYVKGTNLQDTIPTIRQFKEYLALRNAQPADSRHGVFWFNINPTENEAIFTAGLPEKQIKWFTEMERTGGLLNPERRLSFDMNTYINNVLKSKFLKPELERIQKDVVFPMFNVRVAKHGGETVLSTSEEVGLKAWFEFKNYLEGGPTALDARLTGIAQRIFEKAGWGRPDVRGLYATSNLMSNLAYSGMLGGPFGGRPASIIRQLGQLVPSLAELGTRHMLLGVKRATDDFAQGGIEAARLANMGVLTSHIDNLVHAMDIRGVTGRGVSAIADTFLRLFAWTDRQIRIATALGSESKFDEALIQGIEKLRARSDMQQEINKLVAQGQTERARTLYVMDNLANLQFVYGKVNRPEWQRGVAGNLLGLLTSYPLNTVEMFKMMASRAAFVDLSKKKFIRPDNPWPFLRLMTISMLIPYVGSEMLNADLRSVVFFTAMPHSLTLPKAAADIWNTAVSHGEYLTGSLYGIGESSYHKKERNEAYNSAMRDLTLFLPGYQTVVDVNKLINEGSWARLLALTPKGPEIDRLNKQKRMQEAFSEGKTGSSTGGLGSLEGLGGLR